MPDPWGYVSAIDSNGRTIWIVDAHRDDGKRFVVHANEKLTPFLGTGIGGWWDPDGVSGEALHKNQAAPD